MKQWLLAAHPKGRPLESTDFKMVEADMPTPGPGEALLKVNYLGFDPAQKGWMENVADYVAPMRIGDVMRGTGLAEVVESRHDGMPVGSLWTGMTGWQEYCTTKGAGYQPADDSLSPTASLSILGLTGMTAWCGLYKIGRPVPGDTLVVSGAAGATGSLVGQLAKTSGCRVIGIAGGPEKCAWLVQQAGFDAAIDYKGEDIRSRLKELAPKGVQIVFDNVGGKVLDDMLANLAHQARVVICGGISRYETGDLPAGPQNYFNLIFRRAKMEGFIVLDYEDEFPAIRKRLGSLIKDGRISWLEDVQHGFEKAPETLNRLFAGLNKGKQILKL
ncbi:MAG: NADP-dependent oxidoreductase [Parvibaculales bacterium]